MTEDTYEGEKVEEVMLPGFRFHPTDEELVGFYLKRKIQQRPLSIELILQLDIYKYDPWDLPKVACSREKEWYFYCPRDRKYRNSMRPNRVTVAGFWKATGTDRPIYSSKENKCIGLKKSLVFYKGRAAKGVKTEWMMHEFRLPSLIDSYSPNTFMDKNMPPSDSLAICRIFKKPTHSTAQRSAISHHHHRSCPSPILSLEPNNLRCPKITLPDHTTESNHPPSTTSLQPPLFTDMHESLVNTCPLETLTTSFYSRILNPEASVSSLNGHDFLNQFFPFPPLETTSELFSTTPGVSSILQNMWLGSGVVGSNGAPQGHRIIPYNIHRGLVGAETLPNPEIIIQEESGLRNNNYSSPEDEERWETMRSVGFEMDGSNAWKSSSMVGLGWWDTPSCPGEWSTLFSTTKCYT